MISSDKRTLARLLRKELQPLHNLASHVGEVVQVMGKKGFGQGATGKITCVSTSWQVVFSLTVFSVVDSGHQVAEEE